MEQATLEREILGNENYKFRTKVFVILSLILIFFFPVDFVIDLHLGSYNPLVFNLEIGASIILFINLIIFTFLKQLEFSISVFLLTTGIVSFLLTLIKGNEALFIFLLYPFIVAFTKNHKAVIPWNLPFVASIFLLILLKKNLIKINIHYLAVNQSEKTLTEILIAYLTVIIVSYFLAKTSKDSRYEIYNLSVKDPLTGLFNRAFALSFLEREVEEMKRTKTDGLNSNLCVVYIDLDNFKLVNDTYGHSVGDSVLKIVASLFKSFFRKSDVVARLGGDEFLVIARNVDCESLDRRLDDLRSKLEKELKGFRISMSYGMAEIPKDTLDAKRAIELADERMYKNKQERKKRRMRGELPSTEEPTSV